MSEFMITAFFGESLNSILKQLREFLALLKFLLLEKKAIKNLKTE